MIMAINMAQLLHGMSLVCNILGFCLKLSVVHPITQNTDTSEGH